LAWLVDPNYDPGFGLSIKLLFLPAMIFDLPLTMIGDTVTLPYTLAYDRGLFGRMCMYDPPGLREGRGTQTSSGEDHK
jgi:hypothetical protein